MEEDAEDRRRQEGDQHAEDEALGPPVPRRAVDQKDQPAGIDREERQDGAELDQHLERLAGVLEAEEAADEQEMRRRGDRDELGDALDDAEDRSLRGSCRTAWMRASRLPAESACSRRSRALYPEKLGGAVIRFTFLEEPSADLSPDASSPSSSAFRRLPLRAPRPGRIWRDGAAWSRNSPGSGARSSSRSTLPGRCRSWSRMTRRWSSARSVIGEYLHETRGSRFGEEALMPATPAGRAEVRRLNAWFLDKLEGEVTGYLVTEKIIKRQATPGNGGGPPDAAAIRAARSNIRYHMRYIGYLAARRNCLAGRMLSLRRPCRRGRSCRLWTIWAKCHGRRTRCQSLVRAGQVSPELPAAARRPDPRQPALDPLRRPGLLTGTDAASVATHSTLVPALKDREFAPVASRTVHRTPSGVDLHKLKGGIIADAKSEGFDVVRVTAPDAIPRAAARLKVFLADGHHGDMAWLETTAHRRGSPRACGPRPARW